MLVMMDRLCFRIDLANSIIAAVNNGNANGLVSKITGSNGKLSIFTVRTFLTIMILTE